MKRVYEISRKKKKWVYAISDRYQYFKNRLKSQLVCRWMANFGLACFYSIRVGLHVHCFLTFLVGLLLSSLIFLFSVMIQYRKHPDVLLSSDARPILPIKASDELILFEPMISEFEFWYYVNMLYCVAISMTFIPKINIDIPVDGIGYVYIGFWLVFTIALMIEQQWSMFKNKNMVAAQSDGDSTGKKHSPSCTHLAYLIFGRLVKPRASGC